MNGVVRDRILSRKGITLVFGLCWALGSVTATAQERPSPVTAGVDALYSLDFSTAEWEFEALVAREPQNPHYWNYLASTLWLKIVHGQQKLDMESFSGSGLGTVNSRDVVGPAEERRFRNTLDRAMAAANAILKTKPKDTDALYALGVAKAMLGAFEAVVKRSYLAAHARAKEARDIHLQVLKLDPQFRDARLSVGVYEYTVGVIPGLLRFFLGLFGVGGGSKSAGIAAIEDVAANGRRASTDARMILIVIYNREKRFDDALRTIHELHGRYPRNYLFELSAASTYGKMKRWDNSVAVYSSIIGKIEQAKDGYERLGLVTVLLMRGHANIDRLKFDDAIADYGRVTRETSASDNNKADAFLWLGRIYDSNGQRAKAVEQYESVLKLRCDQGFRAEAEKYRRRPWRDE